MNFLLQLMNIIVLPFETWQLQELNSILMAAQNKTEIITIVLFGQINDLQPYIRVMEKIGTPKVVVTLNYGDIDLNHNVDLNRKIFFIAAAAMERKELWNHMNRVFMGIQSQVRGVFITKRLKNQNSGMKVRQHLEWCWNKGFTNVLVLLDKPTDQHQHQHQQFEIFNYNHFLERKIINMTTFPKEEMYPDKFRNLNKFRIRTAGFFDPPRVFKHTKNGNETNKNHLLGYAAKLFLAFLKEYNADTDLKYFGGNNKSYTINDNIQRIENDEIDMSLNPYIPYKKAHLSIPLHMIRRCVVVPFPQELAKYKFFILPFHKEVWFSFIATWLLLSVAKLFGSWLRCSNSLRAVAVDGGQVFLEVWRLMMSLPTSTPYCYNKLKWFNALWFSFIAIMGFIFSNLYMALLTSFFSGVTFNPLIKTLNELIDRRITLDVIDYELPDIVNNRHIPIDLVGLFRARKAHDVISEMLNLKSNYSYAVLEDRIEFAFSQQSHLLQPIQQMVPECLTTMPLGFLIPAHSQFEKPLNRFILRSIAAGLIDKWILDTFKDGYSAEILNMRLPKLEIARPLTLKHFQFGWMVLAGGYFAGFLVFSLENLRIILNRFRIFIVFH